MKQIKRWIIFITVETFLLLLVVGISIGRGMPNFLFLFFLVLQAAAILYVVKEIILPLKKFEEILDECETGEWAEEDYQHMPDNIAYMSQIKKIMEKYAVQKTRMNSAKIFDKQTELTALQSQINPHFLYNTLECIRGQALMDNNAEIARMVEALAAFFRYSISRKGNLVTLRDELANIDNYMLIQKYRFNNRFSMEIIIDEDDEMAYDFLIPRLIIQPVVENSIFHGLEEKLEGGKVIIEIIVTEKNLLITISDNGKGMEPDTLQKLNEKICSREIRLDDGRKTDQRNTGIALPNIHKRIQLLFGEEYGVNVYSTVGQGTDVEITIPVNYRRDGGLVHEKGNAEDS